jgi:hypothetical protein
MPRPDSVDALEGLVVLGDDEHLVGAAGVAGGGLLERVDSEGGGERSGLRRRQLGGGSSEETRSWNRGREEPPAVVGRIRAQNITCRLDGN